MRRSAAATVFTISSAMVSGPTPPGTGLYAPAFSATSIGSTSPTSTLPFLSNAASFSGEFRKIRADVHDRRPRLDEIAGDHRGTPDRGYQQVRFPADRSEVRRLRMRDGHRRELMREQQRERKSTRPNSSHARSSY